MKRKKVKNIKCKICKGLGYIYTPLEGNNGKYQVCPICGEK